MKLSASRLSVLFSFTSIFAAHAQEFSVQDQAGEALSILRGGKVVGRYQYGHDVSTPERRLATYKPFLHVFDPAGEAQITKGDGGAFPHHRGIFIGWNKMTVGGKTYDRWHMKGGDQVHQRFTATRAGADGASFTSLVKWEGATPDATLIEEERTIAFLPAPVPAYALIDMTSKLKALAGDTVLGGDPEHAGLHFRPANEVDRKATTYLYPKANALPHKDRDYPWVAETFTLRGQRFSVVYLNHPANPQSAAISAYRDYGRFGLFFPTTIAEGETGTVRARFLIVAGEWPAAEFIQEQWNAFAGKNDAVPETTTKPAESGKAKAAGK